MAGGGRAGGDAYWPGFVDALTNVVIAMIFVVVVLAISLTFAAQMMGQKLAERIVKEHLAKAAASAASAAEAASAVTAGQAGVPPQSLGFAPARAIARADCLAVARRHAHPRGGASAGQRRAGADPASAAGRSVAAGLRAAGAGSG